MAGSAAAAAAAPALALAEPETQRKVAAFKLCKGARVHPHTRARGSGR
jgi:hypothetical protein